MFQRECIRDITYSAYLAVDSWPPFPDTDNIYKVTRVALLLFKFINIIYIYHICSFIWGHRGAVGQHLAVNAMVVGSILTWVYTLFWFLFTTVLLYKKGKGIARLIIIALCK